VIRGLDRKVVPTHEQGTRPTAAQEGRGTQNKRLRDLRAVGIVTLAVTQTWRPLVWWRLLKSRVRSGPYIPPHENGTIFGELSIDDDPRNVAQVRKWITRRIEATITFPLFIGSEALDDVVLCASETVTNALVHGVAPVTIELLYTIHVIRVEVTDTGHGTPAVPPNGEPLATHGRGLGEIVESLACEWGHFVTDGGLTVWFEVEY
jgi:hypothetical protein